MTIGLSGLLPRLRSDGDFVGFCRVTDVIDEIDFDEVKEGEMDVEEEE